MAKVNTVQSDEKVSKAFSEVIAQSLSAWDAGLEMSNSTLAALTLGAEELQGKASELFTDLEKYAATRNAITADLGKVLAENTTFDPAKALAVTQEALTKLLAEDQAFAGRYKKAIETYYAKQGATPASAFRPNSAFIQAQRKLAQSVADYNQAWFEASYGTINEVMGAMNVAEAFKNPWTKSV